MQLRIVRVLMTAFRLIILSSFRMPSAAADFSGWNRLVIPRPASFFAAPVDTMLATPASAPWRPRPCPESADTGAPATPGITREIQAVLERLIACDNTGDFLRLSALYSDRAARAAVVYQFGRALLAEREQRAANGEAEFTRDEILAMMTGEPARVPDRLISASDVRLHDDGRVTARVVRTVGAGSPSIPS